MDEPPIHDGRFARIERMITSAGLARLQRAHVTVIGLGAVGSYATEALARAGVGHLRLVDFDEVRLSNINRQLFALESTVGRKKAQVARERVLQINPACCVEIEEVHHDPLAAKVRKALRKRGIPVDIRCVYSTETTDHLPPAATEPGPSTPEDTYDRGRRRKTLGSLPTITGIFGLIAANEVIQMILYHSNEVSS